MYCKYCGKELNENAKFCPSCGRPVSDTVIDEINNVTEFKTTTGKAKKKSNKKPVIITAVSLILAAIVGVFAWIAFSDDPVDMVQNGYLGMYTDITVKEILDTVYSPIYSDSDWDWGYTDSEKLIVEASYFNPEDSDIVDDLGIDSIRIQFTVQEDYDCFKVTALVGDPYHVVETPTDLLFALNDMYISAYNMKAEYEHENSNIKELPGDKDTSIATIKLQSVLDETDAACVLYGASADYNGNRSRICEIYNGSLFGANVTDFMNAWWIDKSSDDVDEFEEDYSEYEEPETQPQTQTEIKSDKTLYSVVTGEDRFIMTDAYTHKDASINSIWEMAGYEFESPLIPMQIASVDFDQDGMNEVVVELTDGRDGYRLILRSQDGEVYGYGFNFRSLTNISSDGRFMGSSGADSTTYSTIAFDGYNKYIEYGSSKDGWDPVEFKFFGQEEIDALVPRY